MEIKQRFFWAAVSTSIASFFAGISYYWSTENVDQAIEISLLSFTFAFFLIGYFLVRHIFGARYLVGLGVVLVVGVGTLLPVIQSILYFIAHYGDGISAVVDSLGFLTQRLIGRLADLELSQYDWVMVGTGLFLIICGMYLRIVERRPFTLEEAALHVYEEAVITSANMEEVFRYDYRKRQLLREIREHEIAERLRPKLPKTDISSGNIRFQVKEPLDFVANELREYVQEIRRGNPRALPMIEI